MSSRWEGRLELVDENDGALGSHLRNCMKTVLFVYSLRWLLYPPALGRSEYLGLLTQSNG
jgi:hypothetical protein